MKTLGFATKPLSMAALLSVAAFSCNTYAGVQYFTFSGTNTGGTGSATMLVDITGTTLTATLNNTSPINLIGETDGGNSPGIAGFGFNLSPESLGLTTWTLVARTSTNTIVTIGSNGCDTNLDTCDWEMGTTQDGLTLDYIPQVDNGVDGLIFNPLSLTDVNNTRPGGQNSVYFTEATLTMNFATAPTAVDFLSGNCSSAPCSPFVRMQNVGTNGDGSLKLPGTRTPRPPTDIPEPGVLFLMGAGLLGLGMARRRKSA